MHSLLFTRTAGLAILGVTAISTSLPATAGDIHGSSLDGVEVIAQLPQNSASQQADDCRRGLQYELYSEGLVGHADTIRDQSDANQLPAHEWLATTPHAAVLVLDPGESQTRATLFRRGASNAIWSAHVARASRRMATGERCQAALNDVLAQVNRAGYTFSMNILADD
ncbi:hypothetical protein [Salinisphaera hydrothermalis]|uniref:hypothetical protein n=1 Tax=Salinisphaera hydrothermalis TaxID=563188 RepID=UPI003341C697